MSIADACLVRLSELETAGVVFTLDSGFRIYRRHGNKLIPVLMPECIAGTPGGTQLWKLPTAGRHPEDSLRRAAPREQGA
jgi:hypothetical protein